MLGVTSAGLASVWVSAPGAGTGCETGLVNGSVSGLALSVEGVEERRLSDLELNREYKVQES